MAMNENTELEELIRNATGNVAAPPATPFAEASADDDDESAGLDLSILVLVARRSLLWMILLIALGLTASWLYLRYTKPIYKSASLLKIDERAEADALGLSGLPAAAGGDKTRNKLAGEVELIKSGIIYRRLKDSLALDVNYYVQGTVLETEMYGSSPFHVRYTVSDPSLYNRKFNLKFLSLQRFKLDYVAQGQPVDGEYALGQPITLPGIKLEITGTEQLNESVTEQDYHFTIQNEASVNSYLPLPTLTQPRPKGLLIKLTRYICRKSWPVNRNRRRSSCAFWTKP
jgi:tyrosine-protein kinase Etk/Wzc